MSKRWKPKAVPELRIEGRQVKLAANGEAMERWLAKLLRAAHEIEKLRAQRKRLLKGPSQRFKYQGDHEFTNMGGNGDGLDDGVPAL